MTSKKNDLKKTKSKFGFGNFFKNSSAKNKTSKADTSKKSEKHPVYCAGYEKTGLDESKNPNEIPDDWIWL